MDIADMQIERHPWEPFVPDGARVLIMGTFLRVAIGGAWISIILTVPMTSGI